MIVYLHGFNSASNALNDKVVSLNDVCEVLCINYNSFDTRENIIESIKSQCVNLSEPLMFVGTSLGGYYASILAKMFSCPYVLINPCITPFKTLKPMVGKQTKNFMSCEINVLSKEAHLSYKDTAAEPNNNSFFPLVILAKDDEIIPFDKSMEYFGSALTLVVNDAGHRFTKIKEVIGSIKHYYSVTSFVTDLG